MSASSNQGWRDYWKADRPASCVPAREETNAEIARFWERIFSGSGDGTRILDVATGNGILLAHAARAAGNAGHTFEMTGVDLADIDPQRFVTDAPDGFAKARFEPGIAAEELPFGDGAFDLVVSQYGLEYARLDKALPEACRVLSPGGRLVWLAHCDESEVVRQNADQSAQVEFLLAARGPLAAMDRFVQRTRKGKNPAYGLQRLQDALNAAEKYCRENPPAGIVTEICTVLADTANRWQAFRPQDLETMVADARRRLASHRQRINDLINAVVTTDRQRQIEAALGAGGCQEVSVGKLRAGPDSAPIGLLIEAQRGNDQSLRRSRKKA